MSQHPPIEMVWDGSTLTPVSDYWLARARRTFTIGEVLRIVDEPERSSASHRHYFAALNESHANLPVLLAERFPTPDHLRRYALIQSGYSNSHSLPCASPNEAKKLAAFIRPLDAFAVVTVTGSVVSVFTAKSQSYKDMDKKTFAESKEKVLGFVADLINVSKKELSDNAGAAA